jgi:hypothetical protein
MALKDGIPPCGSALASQRSLGIHCGWIEGCAGAGVAFIEAFRTVTEPRVRVSRSDCESALEASDRWTHPVCTTTSSLDVFYL